VSNVSRRDDFITSGSFINSKDAVEIQTRRKNTTSTALKRGEARAIYDITKNP